jgi:hypothetical protein
MPRTVGEDMVVGLGHIGLDTCLGLGKR